jgi:hypothetical protein
MLMWLSASIWHGALECGGIFRIKKENPYKVDWLDPQKKFLSITSGIECGKRIFLGQGKWFLNPVVHHTHLFHDFPCIGGELRFGRVLGSRIALNLLGGIAFMFSLEPQFQFINMHAITGGVASLKMTDNWSFTTRAYCRLGYTKFTENTPHFETYFKDAQHLVLTVGIEGHRMGYYKEESLPVVIPHCSY